MDGQQSFRGEAALSGRNLTKEANLLARLDRMPLTKTTVVIVGLIILAWLVESFDIGIVGTIVLTLKGLWHLTPAQVGLLGSSSTIGIVIGLLPAGRLADRFGRKTVLLWGMAIFAVFTVASVLATGFGMLLVFRFIAGLGEGAVFPLPYLMFSEFVNSHRRGQANGWAELILTGGYTLPSLAGLWATTTFPAVFAWKVPLIIGAVPLLLIPPIARWVPESPRYLLKQGKADEVERLVLRLEEEARIAHDETLVNPQSLKALEAMEGKPISARWLFRPPYLRRSVVSYAALTSTFILWYAMLTYAPTIFTLMGAKANNALLFTASMMFIAGFGALLQGFLGDRYGRRWVHTLYMVIAAVGLLIMGGKLPVGLVAFATGVTAFFGLGGFSIPKIYVSEQYPTRLRGTGVATGELVSRFLTGVVLVYFIPTMLATLHVETTFIILAVAMLILVAPLLFFGEETANISVEEAGTDLHYVSPEAEASQSLLS